jgi:phosphoserine phosphatase RsbU/P
MVAVAFFLGMQQQNSAYTRPRTNTPAESKRVPPAPFFVVGMPIGKSGASLYNALMADNGQYMQCMEVWGGSQITTQSVQLGGLDAWVYSKPYGNADFGGDIYYASSCATGRITRLLLADVAGHGDGVADLATSLRNLMRRYVNFLDQTKFVRSLNKQFAAMSKQGRFATAIATTFFSPTRVLTVCNAGHPPPFLYKSSSGKWSILEREHDEDAPPSNVPLGIIPLMDYEQFDVELDAGDLVLCYTDALVESRDSAGQMFGPRGLLRVVESVGAEGSQGFIKALLEKISGYSGGNLSEDDVTVMLLKPNGDRPRIRFRQKIGAALRFLGALIRSIDPRAQRPPMPDMKFANIAGAVIPSAAKRWRPTRPLGASRPSRQSIP